MSHRKQPQSLKVKLLQARRASHKLAQGCTTYLWSCQLVNRNIGERHGFCEVLGTGRSPQGNENPLPDKSTASSLGDCRANSLPNEAIPARHARMECMECENHRVRHDCVHILHTEPTPDHVHDLQLGIGIVCFGIVDALIPRTTIRGRCHPIHFLTRP